MCVTHKTHHEDDGTLWHILHHYFRAHRIGIALHGHFKSIEVGEDISAISISGTFYMWNRDTRDIVISLDMVVQRLGVVHTLFLVSVGIDTKTPGHQLSCVCEDIPRVQNSAF